MSQNSNATAATFTRSFSGVSVGTKMRNLALGQKGNYSIACLTFNIMRVFGLLSILFGLITIFAVIVLGFGFTPSFMMKLAAATPGFWLVLTGLFMIGFAEIGRAIVDGSEASQSAATHLKKLADAAK